MIYLTIMLIWASGPSTAQRCDLYDRKAIALDLVLVLCPRCWNAPFEPQCLPCYNTTATNASAFDFYCSSDWTGQHIDGVTCNLSCPAMPPRSSPAPTPYVYKGDRCVLYHCCESACTGWNGGADCQFCAGEAVATGPPLYQTFFNTCKPKTETCVNNFGGSHPQTPVPFATFQGITAPTVHIYTAGAAASASYLTCDQALEFFLVFSAAVVAVLIFDLA
jgi:hypothetical protein